MGGVGGPEGEIALIFAAEIELLLGSFAAPSAHRTDFRSKSHRNGAWNLSARGERAR